MSQAEAAYHPTWPYTLTRDQVYLLCSPVMPKLAGSLHSTSVGYVMVSRCLLGTEHWITKFELYDHESEKWRLDDNIQGSPMSRNCFQNASVFVINGKTVLKK